MSGKGSSGCSQHVQRRTYWRLPSASQSQLGNCFSGLLPILTEKRSLEKPVTGTKARMFLADSSQFYNKNRVQKTRRPLPRRLPGSDSRIYSSLFRCPLDGEMRMSLATNAGRFDWAG